MAAGWKWSPTENMCPHHARANGADQQKPEASTPRHGGCRMHDPLPSPNSAASPSSARRPGGLGALHKSSSAPRRHRAHELLRLLSEAPVPARPCFLTPKVQELRCRGVVVRRCSPADPASRQLPLVALLQNRSLFRTICSDCLWAQDNKWFLSRVQRLAGPAGDRGLLSRVEPPTRTKGPPFVPVGGSTRDKRSNPFYPGW